MGLTASPSSTMMSMGVCVCILSLQLVYMRIALINPHPRLEQSSEQNFSFLSVDCQCRVVLGKLACRMGSPIFGRTRADNDRCEIQMVG